MIVNFWHESYEGIVPIQVKKVKIVAHREECLITYLDGREDYTSLDQIESIEDDTPNGIIKNEDCPF